MSIPVQTFYVATKDPDYPADRDLELVSDLLFAQQSRESGVLSVSADGAAFVSPGESLEDYKQRRKESRAWQPS